MFKVSIETAFHLGYGTMVVLKNFLKIHKERPALGSFFLLEKNLDKMFGCLIYFFISAFSQKCFEFTFYI